MLNHRKILLFAGLLFALVVVGALTVAVARSQDAPDADGQATELDQPTAVEAPSQMLFSYQGRLLDKSGNTINNPSVPMIFELYRQQTGGSNCWREDHTGSNSVKLENGAFQVVLGQRTAIAASCASGDAYLQLTVNGEILSPRERLTSVATAIEAKSLSGGAEVNGDLIMKGSIKAAPGNTNMYLANDQGNARVSAGGSVLVFIDSDNTTTSTDAFQVVAHNSILAPPLKNLFNVYETGNGTIAGSFTVGGVNLNMESDAPTKVVLRYDGNRWLHLLPWGGSGYRWDGICIGCGQSAQLRVNGDTTVYGKLDLRGGCASSAATADGDTIGVAETCSGGSLTTGAIIEANLQTPEELAAGRIERFREGDVLCWTGNQLEKCTAANDRLVQAVASSDGSPIVIGAENIRVIGPVEMGDILVSSSTPGYAMVNNDPAPGTVIAQALEDFSGTSGLVKAMIRKW